MISPTGVIPEQLMYPEHKKAVMELLKAKVGTGAWKREILSGWARVAGCKISAHQMAAVYRTGWDVAQGL